MAYKLAYTVTAFWTADGAGPMGAVPSAQSKKFTQTGFVAVGGADAPAITDFNTALTGSSSTPGAGSAMNDISTQINAALAQIDAWASGGN